MKTVKLLLTGLLSVGFQLVASSQGGVNLKSQSDLVHALPNESHGYLILNAYDHPEVTRWEITFLRPGFNSNGQLVSFSTDRIVTLNGTYFTDQVEYAENPSHSGFINIVGYNNSNSVIVSDGPISFDCWGCWPDDECYSTCVGETYAYTLKAVGEYTVPGSVIPASGNCELSLISPVSVTGNGYYRYFNETEWLAFSTSLTDRFRFHYNLPFDNLSGTDYFPSFGIGYVYSPQAADKIIKIPASSNPSVTYVDNNGHPITSSYIYGIKKAKGLWQGYDNVSKHLITGLDEACTFPIEQLQNYVNVDKNSWTWNTPSYPEATFLNENGLTVKPSVTCYEGSGGTVIGGVGNSSGVSDLTVDTEPCDWTWSHDYVLDVNGEILSFPPTSNIFDWTPCSTSNPPNPNSPWVNWPDLYDEVTLSPADPNNTVGPIVISHRNNSITKQISGNSVNENDLQPGLYHAFFLFHDNSFLSRYIYIGENDVIADLQKDHLTVMASPVPVVEEEFVLDLNSDVSLHFTYKLITSSGDVLFEKVYDMQENEDIKDYIPILNFSGPGVLINHFEFEDGSSKSFNISKY